ncbi:MULTISPECIES: restriction endonuclease subunit S [Microbacterium]|uniref:restriction endonuclease subunit S n=1 Tax=Microbacterium TaxID=33882 RepID=UPI0028F15D75|nr:MULTISPECIES: restriction endonuclease subunit S [Microbacterium]
MREGWREVRLADVSRRRTDFTSVVADDLYRIVGVQRSGWGLVDRAPARGDSMKFDKLMELHEDDLVYRTITAFEAPSTVVPSDFERSFVTPQTFPVYALDRSQILPRYMSLLTTWPTFHEEMSTRCVGTVLRRKTLSKGAFESIPISLPPLIEQRRIVDLVGAVDDAIKAADGEAVAAETLSRSVRRHLLRPRPSWEAVTLGDVSRVVTGRSFKAEHQGRSTGSVPYFRVSDMTAAGNERELLMPNDWLDEEGVAAVKPVVCPPGTVVFPILGAALATEKRRVLGIHAGFVQHMIGLVPGPRVLSGILLAVMQDVRLADFSQHGAMPSVNQKLVSAIAFALPPLDAQERIVEQLRAVENAADAARTTADALRTLRSNLLTVLLSGEHEIPESYDRFLILDEKAAA